MWHSCVRVTVAEHVRGKPKRLVELYREIGRIVRSCGPGVRTATSKTGTGWMVRVRFAGVEFRKDHVVLGFWLKRRVRSPRLKAEHLEREDWIYRLPIRSSDDLDGEVRAGLCEAYRVGRQEYVSGGRR